MPYVEGHAAGRAVSWLHPDAAYLPSIAIRLVAVRRNRFPVHHSHEILPRAITEWLPLFRCINSANAYAMLPFRVVEYGNGITIGNSHHRAGNGRRTSNAIEYCEYRRKQELNQYAHHVHVGILSAGITTIVKHGIGERGSATHFCTFAYDRTTIKKTLTLCVSLERKIP